MPLYTYKCCKCSTVDDYLVNFSAPVPPCKKCGNASQEKQVSQNTGFCLMGYGWSKPGMTAS